MAHRFGRKVQVCPGVAWLLVLAAASLGALAARAQGAPPPPRQALAALVVESSLERLEATNQGGFDTSIVRDVDEAASPSDQWIYSARFTNRSRQILDAVRITSPIPADLRYLPRSATGPASTILFSVDDARTFGPPAELVVASAAGANRVADAADYTHVRWILEGPLDVGATGVVRFGAVSR